MGGDFIASDCFLSGHGVLCFVACFFFIFQKSCPGCSLVVTSRTGYVVVGGFCFFFWVFAVGSL